MTDLIIIFILLIIVMVISGFIYRCSDCGKLFSIRRINHQGCRRVVCKHCGKEK
jgi:DNA-directed RNA polymerase subunit RPC12/RpoP